jgi:hypothetical protein
VKAAILAYNDGATPNARVSREDAIKMLRAHGWEGASKEALNKLCRTKFGRRSYGTP